MHKAPFDYDFNNTNDDFLPAIRHIGDHYDLLLFATPVYWYSMSGIMKNFFDRISDCLKIEKGTGRKLKGKKMAMVSIGSDDKEIPGYYIPFPRKCEISGNAISGASSYLNRPCTYGCEGRKTNTRIYPNIKVA
jgi:multimeric flavodoxin WrbA